MYSRQNFKGQSCRVFSLGSTVISMDSPSSGPAACSGFDGFLWMRAFSLVSLELLELWFCHFKGDETRFSCTRLDVDSLKSVLELFVLRHCQRQNVQSI